jgi:hypothetical protein
VTIGGFVLAGNGGLSNANYLTMGIAIDRTHGFAVRGNVVRAAEVGIFTRASSGLVEGNYSTSNGCGACLTGGNGSYPATVTATGNRITRNNEGLIFNGAGDVLFPFIPRVQSTVNENFDTLVGIATGNDISNQNAVPESMGIRVMIIGLYGDATHTSRVTATISNNTMDKNSIGILIDAGLPQREVPYKGTVTATFQNNVVSNSSTTAALLTFTRSIAALDPQELFFTTSGDFGGWNYLQNSTFTISHTGELDDLWIDHPVQDPVDCRTLCNNLQINGRDIPRGTRSAELGPPLMSACPAPLPVCPPQL